MVEVQHARAVLVVHDVRVVFRLHDVIGTVRRGRVGEVAGNHVAEFLLKHVQEQHVEIHLGAIGQSAQFVHVVGEGVQLGCDWNTRKYIDFVKVIEPLLSLGGMIERNQLLLHVVVRFDMVANKIGGLFSQLSFEQNLESYLISCIIVGSGDNLDLSGNVDIVVYPRDKNVSQFRTRKKQLLGSRQYKEYLSSLYCGLCLKYSGNGEPKLIGLNKQLIMQCLEALTIASLLLLLLLLLLSIHLLLIHLLLIQSLLIHLLLVHLLLIHLLTSHLCGLFQSF